MTIPTAEMNELLSLLRGIDSVEALETTWPKVTLLLRTLDDAQARRKRKVFRRMRPRIDPRDGSWNPGEVEVRFDLPAEWYDFHNALLTEILPMPALLHPLAFRERDRLQRFIGKITRNLPERREKPLETS